MDPKKHHNALDSNSRLHWYEFKSILGQGGFGITYLAFDTNLKQQVAIKEYLPVEFSTRDASNTVQPISDSYSKIYRWGLQRFLQEAQTLARFKHPNIVQVRTFFEHNNTGYIVMDYEKGVELSTLIGEGAHFNEQRLLDIILPILDGLAQIHKAGIIHRDIKPENIFIRDDQSPVLLDFGSARQAINSQTNTMTSLVTPGYAPFEQYHQAEGKQGPWTDIYALGATCYCAITSKPPPDALKRGMVQFEHGLDVYLALADIKAGKYSEHLLEAIDCALCFKAKDRPQTVAEWQQMLTGSKPLQVPGVKAEQANTVETPPLQTLGTKTEPEKAEDRAGRSLRSTLGNMVLLGLLVAAGWYAYNHQRDIESWIEVYIEDINARQLATQERGREARRKELLRQEALKKKLEQEAMSRALEQEKLEQQQREQRKKALQAELARLEQETTQMAAQPEPDELEKLRREKELLAEQTRREVEYRKREQLARQEAERKLEEEWQKLEREKKRLAQQQKQVEEETMLAEIARQQKEKLRAEDIARLRAENLAVAKRLLQSAEEFYRNDRLEQALTDYRNAYDLNASTKTSETAVQGIIDTMARLYAGGNSETWQLFKGNQLKNLSGEYAGNYTDKDKASENEKSPAISTMVAHKDKQLTMAAVDLGMVVIANIEDGKGDLTFHDTKNDVHGTGTITTDSIDSVIVIEWSNTDDSIAGSWRAQNQNTLWHIDLNGEYIAEVANAHVSVFRKKSFNFTLTDLTTPSRAGNPNEIVGISEDESIKISGSKVEVNRIEYEFKSDAYNIQGKGWFEISGVHGEQLKGAWEIPGFRYDQSSGDWILRKIQK
jgi:serine/threonine protein kinase